MLQILLPSGQCNQFASFKVHEELGKKLLIRVGSKWEFIQHLQSCLFMAQVK